MPQTVNYKRTIASMFTREVSRYTLLQAQVGTTSVDEVESRIR